MVSGILAEQPSRPFSDGDTGQSLRRSLVLFHVSAVFGFGRALSRAARAAPRDAFADSCGLSIRRAFRWKGGGPGRPSPPAERTFDICCGRHRRVSNATLFGRPLPRGIGGGNTPEEP